MGGRGASAWRGTTRRPPFVGRLGGRFRTGLPRRAPDDDRVHAHPVEPRVGGARRHDPGSGTGGGRRPAARSRNRGARAKVGSQVASDASAGSTGCGAIPECQERLLHDLLGQPGGGFSEPEGNGMDSVDVHCSRAPQRGRARGHRSHEDSVIGIGHEGGGPSPTSPGAVDLGSPTGGPGQAPAAAPSKPVVCGRPPRCSRRWRRGGRSVGDRITRISSMCAARGAARGATPSAARRSVPTSTTPADRAAPMPRSRARLPTRASRGRAAVRIGRRWPR